MRYRLADDQARVPMPERGGALFPAGPEGASINPLDLYYARMIDDGDLIAVPEAPAAPARGARKGD